MFEVVPDIKNMEMDLMLCKQYGLSFEYNDFMYPGVLDDETKVNELVDYYLSLDRDRSRDTLHGVFFDMTPHSSDSLIREASKRRMRQSMDIAQRLGIRGVVFHTNTIPNFRDPIYLSLWIEGNASFYRELLRDYPGLEIYVENMFDMRYDEILALAKEMADEPRFGICLDYAHASCFSHDAKEWLRVLAPYIKHLHINDNDLKDDLHNSLGDGLINWDEFVEQYRACGLQASILIEVAKSEKKQASLEFVKGWSLGC